MTPEKKDKILAFTNISNVEEGTDEDDILVKFTNDTTLHGLKNACKRGTNIFRRVLWVTVILCMIVGCTVMMAQSTAKYLRYGSLTSTSKLLNTSLDFPSITVCNMNIHKLSVVTTKYPLVFRYQYLLSMAELGSLNATEAAEMASLQEYIKTIDLGTFMQDVAFTPREMFVNCYFQYGSISRSCWDFLSPLHTDRGICQTFQSKDFIKHHGAAKIVQPGPNYGLTITLNVMKSEYYFAFGLGYGMLILVHDPSVYPLMEQKGFAVSPGKETFVAIQKYITKRLSTPYSVQDCVDTNNEGNEGYSRELCLFNCLAKEMYGNTCVYGVNGSETCTVYDAHVAENNLRRIGDVAGSQCTCLPTCMETFYQYRVTAIDFPNNYAATEAQRQNWTSRNMTFIGDNYAHVKIYFDTFEYVTNEQLPAMTADQIVADIGGQLGICLGASIITIAEFFDYGIVAAMFFVRKFKKRKSGNSTTRVSHITPGDN